MVLMYCGCDPGLSGGFAVVSGDKIRYKIAMPTLSFKTKEDTTKTEIDRQGVLSFLSRLPPHTHVVIEEQKAFRGQDITASCTICRNYGILQMALTAAHMYTTEVPPSIWQEHFGIVSVDKAGGKTTKEQALYVAETTFPDVDFRKSDRSRKPHDGMVDASLLAVYCQSIFSYSAVTMGGRYSSVKEVLDYLRTRGMIVTEAEIEDIIKEANIK